MQQSIVPQGTGVAPSGDEQREPEWLVSCEYYKLLREMNSPRWGKFVEVAKSLMEMSRSLLGNAESRGMSKAEHCFFRSWLTLSSWGLRRTIQVYMKNGSSFGSGSMSAGLLSLHGSWQTVERCETHGSRSAADRP